MPLISDTNQKKLEKLNINIKGCVQPSVTALTES